MPLTSIKIKMPIKSKPCRTVGVQLGFGLATKTVQCSLCVLVCHTLGSVAFVAHR